MKKLFYMISAVALVASFAACNKMEQGNDPVTDGPQVETPSADGTVTLNILAAAPQTKMYMSGGHTKWTSGDVITVFAADGTSAVSDAPTGAEDEFGFTVAGWDASKVPSIALAAGPLTYYSYYDEVAYTDGVIRAKLRPQQSLYHSNSFSKFANIAVGELAYNEETGVYSTTMRNLCGLIGINVAGDKVTKVVISDANGKPMTGEIDMVMEAEGEINVPTVSEVVEGVSSVTLTASKASWNGDTDYFKAETTVYACVFPGEYNLVVEAYGDDDALLNTLTAKESITIARNQYKTINVPVDTYKPAEHKTIIVDFESDQPFTESISGTATNNTSPKTFTLKGDEGYQFTINSKNNYSRVSNNGRYCLRLVQNSGTTKEGYILLPAIEGFALSMVTVTSNNTSGKFFYIESADPFSNVPETSIELELDDAPTNEVKTKNVTLDNPISGHGYYLYTKGNNAQITKLVLDYIQAN